MTTSGGNLVLSGYQDGGKYASGGVMLKGASIRYGRVDVRYKATAGPYTYAFLLWPTNNQWPPEIDFAEDAGGNRQTSSLTMHYNSGGHQQEQQIFAGDFTQWRTVSLEWTPGKLTVSVDGVTKATMNSANVPSTGMDLVMQQQAWPCNYVPWYTVCPNASTPTDNIYIDYVHLYSWTG